MELFQLTRLLNEYGKKSEVVLTFKNKAAMDKYIEQEGLEDGVDYTDVGPAWQDLGELFADYNELIMQSERNRMAPRHAPPRIPKFYKVDAGPGCVIIRDSWDEVLDYIEENGPGEVSVKELSLDAILEMAGV